MAGPQRIEGADGLLVEIPRPHAKYPVEGFLMYGAVNAVFDRPSLSPHRVAISLQLDEHQRLAVHEVTLQRRPFGAGVSATDMRLPINQLVREILELVSLRITERTKTGGQARRVDDQDAARLLRLASRRKSAGPWKLDDDHLREVAQVYLANLAGAVPPAGAPVQAVMAHFGVPRPTASRWIQLARSPEKGFLPKDGDKA